MRNEFINRIVPAIALCLLALAAPAGRADDQKKDADRLWADLSSQDESKASWALLTLVKTPKETLTLLAARLKPVKADSTQVKKLIEQLDADDYENRETATRELEYLDRFAKEAMKKALEDKPTAEVKKRLEALLARIPTDGKDKDEPFELKGRSISTRSVNGVIEIFIDGKKLDIAAMVKGRPAPTPNMQWARAVRAVAVLEHIGTEEAKAVLKKLAEGEAGAKPTDEAKAALERLGKVK